MLEKGFWIPVFSKIDYLQTGTYNVVDACKMVHTHVPKYLCDVAHMVKKATVEKWKINATLEPIVL